MLKLGNTDINALGNNINKAYLGAIEVFGNVFVSLWETTTANETITLPTPTNYRVDWGDGTVTTNTNSHEYLVANQYTIKISGEITDFAFNNGGDKDNILEISKYGGLILILDGFSGCSNIDITAIKTPVLTTDLNDLFKNTTSLVFNNSVNDWDLSNTTILRSSFSGSSFNQPINKWDVSNITDLSNFVSFNTEFNQPVNDWVTSSLLSILSMFNGCTSFNQDLNNFDVSRCTSFATLFFNASSFNGDISSWEVSNVTLFNNLFRDAEVFNREVNNWVTSSLNNLTQAFRGALAFNKPLNNWNTSGATNMSFCFRDALAFNQDISNWSFVSCINMSGFMQNKGVEYDTTYMDNLYIKLDQDLVFSNMADVNISFGSINYTSAGATARASLVSKGFIITSGIQV
jgi:hypothetical protein